MKKIDISRWKIKSQMLLAMVVLTLCATLFLAIMIWGIAKNVIEGNYKKTYESNLKSFNAMIDYKLESVNELVRSAVFSAEFQGILSEKNAGGSSYYSTRAMLLLNKMAISLESQSNLIDAVFIFDNTGRCYMHLRGNKSGSGYFKFYSDTDITQETWYQIAREAKGKESFFGYNVLLGEADGTLSLVKEIRNTGNRESLGMMVVGLSDTFLRNSLIGNKKEFKSDMLMILDEKTPGEIFYHTGSGEEDEKLIDYYRQKEDNQGDYLFTSCDNYMTGWKVVNGIQKWDLSRDSVYIGRIIVLSAVFIVILCIAVSAFVSVKINQPLRRLENALYKVRQGSRNITDEFDDGEIGKIGNILKETINHNVELKERVLKLHVKERESELMLLQAQINPHFLYNTLDSIYCKAMLREEEDIACMVNNLSQTFKIALNNGKQHIRISEEMEYIEKYLEIQDIRYEGRFELITEIEQDIMDLHIIKFILQPFVENAMYHGLEPKIGKGFIEIKGERLENDLYFTISDNGIGMEKPTDIYSGYGIGNVVERIRLFYGEEYGVEITSESGVGTRVKMHIPVMEKESGQQKELYDDSSCDR